MGSSSTSDIYSRIKILTATLVTVASSPWRTLVISLFTSWSSFSRESALNGSWLKVVYYCSFYDWDISYKCMFSSDWLIGIKIMSSSLSPTLRLARLKLRLSSPILHLIKRSDVLPSRLWLSTYRVIYQNFTLQLMFTSLSVTLSDSNIPSSRSMGRSMNFPIKRSSKYYASFLTGMNFSHYIEIIFIIN